MPSSDTDLSPNWFAQGGAAYARFRPDYPPQLHAFLASLSPANSIALDVGCGNGQLTLGLAKHFTAVIGLDPSADQIAHAPHHKRINYLVAPAERIPLPENSVDLITAAQAAHWFNLPAFYTEVRRVAIPGGALALTSYGVLKLEPGLDERFSLFYHEEIGQYWPSQRKLVDMGYATIDFPFTEHPAPALEISRRWDLAELLGYLSTWSAVRQARDAGRQDILQAFSREMSEAWGDSSDKRLVRWPVNMRIGRL